MALTRATDKIIANADGNLNLSGIVTASSFSGSGANLSGINTAFGNSSVNTSGIITASSFFGDGSNLTNLPAGLGTALSSTQTSPLNKIYFTDRVLSIGSTVTVDHPATATGAYTQYSEITIEDDADLIIADGDDLIPDILGLGDTTTTGAGGSGRLRIDTITNKTANGAPNFPNGLTGTAGTFTGAITAASGTITGNLGVGGVLTYEDVTNVDSVGIITARSGIHIDDSIVHIGDTNTKIRFPAADTITAETDGSEKVRITSDGNLLVGATAVEDWDGSRSHKIQVRGSNSNNAGISALITANDDNPCEIVLGKSRSTGNTIVGSADDVGQIRWSANDGNGFHSIAFVRASMDGTPGSDDLPSKITFGTSADGGTTVSERMRISSNGLVTRPYQYFLHAERSGNQTGYNAGGAFGTPIIYNQIVTENKDSSLSSCFNTSNGLFTAPVTGVYLFNAAAFGGSGNIFSQSWFTLSGVRGSGTDWVIQNSSAFVQNFQIMRLAAGNTVGYKPYASGNSNVTIQANPNHTYFKVTLIG